MRRKISVAVVMVMLLQMVAAFSALLPAMMVPVSAADYPNDVKTVLVNEDYQGYTDQADFIAKTSGYAWNTPAAGTPYPAVGFYVSGETKYVRASTTNGALVFSFTPVPICEDGITERGTQVVSDDPALRKNARLRIEYTGNISSGKNFGRISIGSNNNEAKDMGAGYIAVPFSRRGESWYNRTTSGNTANDSGLRFATSYSKNKGALATDDKTTIEIAYTDEAGAFLTSPRVSVWLNDDMLWSGIDLFSPANLKAIDGISLYSGGASVFMDNLKITNIVNNTYTPNYYTITVNNNGDGDYIGAVPTTTFVVKEGESVFVNAVPTAGSNAAPELYDASGNMIAYNSLESSKIIAPPVTGNVTYNVKFMNPWRKIWFNTSTASDINGKGVVIDLDTGETLTQNTGFFEVRRGSDFRFRLLSFVKYKIGTLIVTGAFNTSAPPAFVFGASDSSQVNASQAFPDTCPAIGTNQFMYDGTFTNVTAERIHTRVAFTAYTPAPAADNQVDSYPEVYIGDKSGSDPTQVAVAYGTVYATRVTLTDYGVLIWNTAKILDEDATMNNPVRNVAESGLHSYSALAAGTNTYGQFGIAVSGLLRGTYKYMSYGAAAGPVYYYGTPVSFTIS